MLSVSPKAKLSLKETIDEYNRRLGENKTLAFAAEIRRHAEEATLYYDPDEVSKRVIDALAAAYSTSLKRRVEVVAEEELFARKKAETIR